MKTQNFYGLILFILISISLITCKKDDNFSYATVTTYSPLYISSTAASVGYIVESDGGSHITDCGIYISNSQNPESTGTKFQIGSDTGVFMVHIRGFLPNVKYYNKAYAKNEKGESLGNEVNYVTPDTITDYDNNVYETVKIDNQLWMAENLKTTRYRNGDIIGTTTPATADISGESEPKYQWAYNGDESKVAVYGRLYTCYVATDNRGICPTGWHLPTDAEFTSLTNLLGGNDVAGGKMKESGTSHWSSPNTGATNETLFSALPGGAREDASGIFRDIGTGGFFWSSTEFDVTNAWYWHLPSGSSQVGRIGADKAAGFSIRCIKD